MRNYYSFVIGSGFLAADQEDFRKVELRMTFENI